MKRTSLSLLGKAPRLLLITVAVFLLIAAHFLLFQSHTAQAQGDIIYVNAAANGAANGSSWDDAYTTLQDALALAVDGDEIWVAKGIYTPGASRSDSFNIPAGVSLYGGFAGGENELEARDWEANPTVLSGDIGGDDKVDGRGVVTDTANIKNINAYRVVRLDGTTTPITTSTRLDGVIITAGQANGFNFPDDNSGGGLYCNGSGAGNVCSPTLTNVTFSGNRVGKYGGAMYNDGSYGGESSPTLANVTFSSNSAQSGGAMYNDGSYGGESGPTLTNVTFSSNLAEQWGGAMYNAGRDGESSPTLTSVIFIDNSASGAGGAMFNSGFEGGNSDPRLTDVTFSNNWAANGGGAMINSGSGGNSSPTLTNVTFIGNVTAGNGGAMRNSGSGGNSRPRLTNVTFSSNSAGNEGGAMYNSSQDGGDSSPTLSNVSFSGNSSGSDGGAVYNNGSYDGDSSPTLSNVAFSGNSAGGDGGAIFNQGWSGKSSPTLINVTFSGNRAAWDGGAMYNHGWSGKSSPTLTNVTFHGNWAAWYGGAMYNYGFDGESNPRLTNVILWNNSAGSEGGDVMFNNGATPTIAYSLVEGGLDGPGIGGIGVNDGGYNINADPLFVTPVDPGDAPTTDGDLRLQPCSPAVDAGNSHALPADVTTDLDGNPRIAGGAVDMGAYEFQFECAAVVRLYVDDDASGANDGSSWDNAFTSLQDALAVAEEGDEIWVAAGVYYPDEGIDQTDDDPYSTFSIPPGVSLYGGFAGGEEELEEREWEANPTVLSGDIDGNDITDERGVVTDTANIVGDNAYHVVKLDGTTTPITASTRIDGVIITAGQANGEAFPDNAGGGLFCDGRGVDSVCSPTLTNVIFSGNWAGWNGGAMFNDGQNGGVSSPTLNNVTFAGNSADYGGAIYNDGWSGESSPILTNVTFSGNSAEWSGGAMFNNGFDGGNSSPTLTNVAFAGNSTNSGGAMFNNGEYGGQSNPTLTDVTFSGNSATGSGGAMYNNGSGDGVSSPTLTNVTFAGNSATGSGGAMFNNGWGYGVSSPTLTNVTFAGNSATGSGGAMFNEGSFDGESSPNLNNVILWGNSAGNAGDVMHNSGTGAMPTIAHSLVQGGWDGSGIVNDGGSVTDGGGNIDANPLFMTPINPADAPTTAGDLRLRPDSPAIDAGDNNALPDGLTTDLDGNPRIQGGAVDMGAYEYTPALLTVGMVPTIVLEDSGQALTVTFTRTQNTVGELAVAFDVGGTATSGDDYVLSGADSFDGSSGAFILADGVINHTLLLTPIADLIAEPDETIILTLAPRPFYVVEAAGTVTGTILNDDTAEVLVSPTTGLTITEAGGTATFTVTLQSEPTGMVTVTLTSSDPTEGTVSPEVLTFDASNWQVPQTVTVTGVDDNEDDGDVTYTIELAVSSDDPFYDRIDVPPVTVTNLDDDDPPPPPAQYRAYLPLLFGPPPPSPAVLLPRH